MRSNALALAALAGALAGCGGSSFNARGADAYAKAVDAQLDGNNALAAQAAYVYVKDASQDDDRYDRALIILARAAERMHLDYAASLYYLDVAQSRRNVDLLDDAVEGLRRIAQRGGLDPQAVVRGYLGSAEITGLRPDLQAFVDYYQGVDDLQHGAVEWARVRFDRIPKRDEFRHRARFANAVWMLATDQRAEGRAELAKLLETAAKKENGVPRDVVEETRLALARLDMEEGRYDAAVDQYDRVRYLATRNPRLLLELAWAEYYRGDSRRALGFLIALDAPAYRGLIAPERFLLEALSLRRLCQFEPARIAAARLHDRYGDALRDISDGVLPAQSKFLRRAAQRRGESSRTWELLERLRRERKRISADRFGGPLSRALLELYDNGIAELTRRFDEQLRPEAAALAGELVEADEGVRVILHELSVGLLRGRHRPKGPLEVPPIDLGTNTDRVSYEFQGEFWTDEIDDLVVRIPDKCFD